MARIADPEPPTTPAATDTVKTPKRMRPETLGEAQAWERRCLEVQRRGICRKCAGQYAWGIEIGFADSKPPCRQCRPIVDASNGRQRPNGWRTMHRVRAGEWSA